MSKYPTILPGQKNASGVPLFRLVDAILYEEGLFLSSIGVTRDEMMRVGIPDFINIPYPGKQIDWNSGEVGSEGITYKQELLKEFYRGSQKQSQELRIKKPKTPKQRSSFRAAIKSAGASEEITSLFRAIASLPTKEKEVIGKTISEVLVPVEKNKPKQRKSFRTTTKKLGASEEIVSLFKAASIAASQRETEPKTPTISEKTKKSFSLPSTILLPNTLRYTKGREGVYSLIFESDVDKATYFLGKSPTYAKKDSGTNETRQSSENKKQVWEWLKNVTGWTEVERRQHRNKILEEIKKLHQSQKAWETNEIVIPPIYKKEETFEDETIAGIDNLLEEILNPIKDKETTDSEEELPPEVSDLIDEVLGKIDSRKKKTTRAKSGQLTKRQEEILQGILNDLINIRHRLAEIKKAQEDKVTYEKRRDRLQAERLSFLERERQIEALPQITPDASITGKLASQRDERKKQTEKSFTERLTEGARNIFNVSLLSGLGSMFFGGGGSPQTQQPSTIPGQPSVAQTQQTNNFNFPQAAKSALKVSPIPGINMVPFADGGTLTPLGSNNSSGTSIRPLETSSAANIGGTTFSRGFSMEDLKSPLADVMKLPLKVAGAALLSAISKLFEQFGVTDSKLQSDLSKMIGDVSKAFGLQKPSFGTTIPTGGNTNISISGGSNEQTVLASSLNQIAGTLTPTGGTQSSSPSPQVAPPSTEQQDTPRTTQPTNPQSISSTSIQPSSNSGQTLTDRAREAGTSGNTDTVEPKPYLGGSSNILKPQSANIAMNSSTTNIEQGGLASYQNSSGPKYSFNYNKENKLNYKISPSIQKSYDSLNAFSSLEYNPSSKNTTQNILANTSIQEQTDSLKFNPTQRLTPSRMAIAMGMTLPDDKTTLNSSTINVVTLPAINRTRKQSVPDPETILVTGKPPSGLNGYNPYALVG